MQYFEVWRHSGVVLTALALRLQDVLDILCAGTLLSKEIWAQNATEKSNSPIGMTSKDAVAIKTHSDHYVIENSINQADSRWKPRLTTSIIITFSSYSKNVRIKSYQCRSLPALPVRPPSSYFMTTFLFGAPPQNRSWKLPPGLAAQHGHQVSAQVFHRHGAQRFFSAAGRASPEAANVRWARPVEPLSRRW